MPITLQKQHEDLLHQAVANGRFDTIDAALAFAIEHLLPGDDEDLAWARALVDTARAQIDVGAHPTIDDVRGDLRDRMRRLTAK